MSQSVTQMKKKRTRSPSVAKPAFIVVQVLGDDGQPEPFDKRRLKIVTVERSAEKVMELMEGGEHANAIYLRVIIPVSRQAQARKDQAA